MSDVIDLSPKGEEYDPHAFPPSPRTTRQVLRWVFDNVEELFTGALVAVMIVSVVVSVFYRYVLSEPLPWTEEIVLLCMIWVCFIGASVAAKTKEHIVIDIVLAVVPRRIARAMEAFSLSVVIILLAIIVWQGLILLDKTQFMRTTALGMPEGYMYAAVPVAGVLMIIHNVQHLYRDLRGG